MLVLGWRRLCYSMEEKMGGTEYVLMVLLAYGGSGNLAVPPPTRIPKVECEAAKAALDGKTDKIGQEFSGPIYHGATRVHCIPLPRT